MDRSLSIEEKAELVRLLEEKERRKTVGGHLAKFFPDSGPLAAEHYPKHMRFFGSGGSLRERIFMAANRVGKTVAGAYEMACHLTGQYPDWWTGRRFNHPVQAWAAGDTGQTTRDVVQVALLGEEHGTGMLAKDVILKTVNRPGVPNAIDTVQIQHASGGVSHLGFKSFDQKRRSFQGTGKHVIWLDEECPQDVYSEAAVRTMTTKGLIYVTFTPLSGLTAFIQDFMGAAAAMEEKGEHVSKGITMAGWDDVPHLSEHDKREILEATPDYLKESRSKGTPGLGSGAIYRIPRDEVECDIIALPPWFRRGYAMDVGWNCTAVVFFAIDPERDIMYIYDVYKRGHAEPDVHTAAIKRRYVHKQPLFGVIDPASGASSQKDGEKLLNLYRKEGLKLMRADNAVEAGIEAVYRRLSTGRLKVFRGLSEWFDEYALYRRNEKGKIVKEDDHLMDATKYAVLSGEKVARPVNYHARTQIRGGQGKRYF